MELKKPDRHLALATRSAARRALLVAVLLCLPANLLISHLAAAPGDAPTNGSASASAADTPTSMTNNAGPWFRVVAYSVEKHGLLPTNVPTPILSNYTGTRIGLDRLVKAALEVQRDYRQHGYPQLSVALTPEAITNGIVTLNVFQTALPQIVVSGQRWLVYSNGTESVTANLPAAVRTLLQRSSPSIAATNAAPPAFVPPVAIATPAEIQRASAAVSAKIAELNARQKDTRIHVVSTNSGPRFAVQHYLITGNTVLSPETMARVLTNIDGAFGTNVSFDGVRTAVGQLQGAYRERGYVTVAVTLPRQKLTNATVRMKVIEGRLSAINISGNRYFSSNNVMRALPGLHTNMLLNGPVFQAELNRANANQDRQVYPIIGPGALPGTTELTLRVKDRLPLHAKLELDNKNSPGTPDLRVNASAIEENLWQRGHSLGIQYGFSPESYKQGNQWSFYDRPLVANYGAFYRLPLGSPEPIADTVARNPTSFGYNEATRKFNLPPVTGRPELTLFASRATIDTGLGTIDSKTYSSPFTNGDQVYPQTLNEDTVHQDVTVNSGLGARLSFPLRSTPIFHSIVSGGLDYKRYKLSSAETNVFTEQGVEIDYNTRPPSIIPVGFTNYSPVPYTVRRIEYLPLSLRYDASLRDPLGTTSFGLGISANLWYSSVTSKTSSDTNGNPHTAYLRGADSLRAITGSRKSSGHWVVITPSFSRQFVVHDWITSIRESGQWASEPLINNEQFGLGGVNSVRGYHEGEVFGDTGWQVSLEQRTPAHVIGTLRGGEPLTIRASVYMDYGRVYLLDPQGRAESTALWGAGVGLASALGSHWQAQLLFSVPLISTLQTPRDRLHFNFALTGQF